METLKDWLLVMLGCTIVSITVLLVWALFLGYTDFMDECVQHHERYECRVMYRG